MTAATTEPEDVVAPPRVSATRWVPALAGGMVVWLLRLVAGSLLVSTGCRLGPLGGRVMLLAVSVVGVAICALFLRWGLQVRRAASDAEPWWEAVGVVAVLVDALAIAAIVVESVPILLLDLCR